MMMKRMKTYGLWEKIIITTKAAENIIMEECITSMGEGSEENNNWAV